MPDILIHLVLASVLFGFLLGIITGLTPGLHVNNVALLLVAFSSFLLKFGFTPLYIAIVIVANAVTHTLIIEKYEITNNKTFFAIISGKTLKNKREGMSPPYLLITVSLVYLAVSSLHLPNNQIGYLCYLCTFLA